MTEAKRERNAEIIRLHAEGMTYAALGDQFGVTRERIRQIVMRDAPQKVRPSSPRRYYLRLCAQCGHRSEYHGLATTGGRCGQTFDCRCRLTRKDPEFGDHCVEVGDDRVSPLDD